MTTDPENPDLFYRRGLANYLKRHHKSCIKDLRKAIEFNINTKYLGNIYYHIGISFAWIDKYHRAIEPLSKAIEAHQDDIRYYHERAKCFTLVQMYENALEDFNIVLEKQPKNANALFGRGFAYKNLGMFQDAANDWERAKVLDPSNPKLCINYKHVYDVNYIEL